MQQKVSEHKTNIY